jgi:hypothetical protein
LHYRANLSAAIWKFLQASVTSLRNATNGANGSKFIVDPHTPTINALGAALLSDNPNSANPFRLDPSQRRSCDITHSYLGEQKEYNGGLLNKFVQFNFPYSVLIQKILATVTQL